MEQRRITPMTTAGCFAAIIVILAFLSVYVPIFSMVGFFIMPIPITIMYMKFGFRQAILTGIAAGILISITISPIEAVIKILTFGAIGLAIGEGFRRELAPVKMFGLVTAVCIIVGTILIGAAFLIMGINEFAVVQDMFNQITIQAVEQYEASGVSEMQVAEYKRQFSQVQQMLPAVLPLLFCLATAIIGYINIKVSQVILLRLGFSVKPFLPIRYWEISRSMIYLYILAIVANYWGTTRDIEWLNIIGLNLYQMAFFFICVEGIALLFYLLHRHFHIGNGLQAFFLISFFVIPVFSYLAFMAGLFDMIAGYRKKRV